MRVTPPTPPHKGRAIAYEDGFPSPRQGEGRVRGASIEKRPERAAALTFPLLRNGPLPLPIGERNSGEAPICDCPATRGRETYVVTDGVPGQRFPQTGMEFRAWCRHLDSDQDRKSTRLNSSH